MTKDQVQLVITVGLTTLPSILWLVMRFVQLLHQHRRKILYHVRNPGQSGPLAAAFFVFHVVAGVGLLSAVPYFVYLLLPPRDPRDSTQLPLSSWVNKLGLITVALTLWLVNMGIPFFIPHPSRYREYYCDSERPLARSLAPLHITALSFLAMIAQALHVVGLILLPDSIVGGFLPFPTSVILVAVALYSFLLWMCTAELLHYPWEQTALARLYLEATGWGMKAKSRLTQAYLVADEQTFSFTLYSFVVLNVAGLFQSLCMLRNVNPAMDRMIPRPMLDFMVVFLLYMTLIMCAGFFLQAQALFELQTLRSKVGEEEAAGNAQGNRDARRRLDRLHRILVLDLMLTQLCPIFANAIAPFWTGHATTIAFMCDQLAWTYSM